MKVKKLDYSNRVITPLFPSLLYQDKKTYGFDEIKDGLIEYAYKQREEDDVNQVVSNRGGWQTPTVNTRFFNKESFKPYMSWFGDRIKEYIDHMNFNMSSGRDIYLASMWFNINGKGHYNASHNHPNTTVAGVLWIKAPKNCGHLVFESQNEFSEYNLMSVQKQETIDEYLACPAYRIVPSDGLMVLFPSHLRHYVDQNESDEDRISLAFNIDFRLIDG